MAKQPSLGRETAGRPDAHGAGRPSSQDATETMAEAATAAGESAKAATAEQIEQHKAAASQSLDAFAQAVRKASDELSNQDQTAAARLIREAAGGLESLSKSLANQSLEDMVGSLREVGRRNPAALFGGAALAGLAIGRFARSSREGNAGTGTSDLQTRPASTSDDTGAFAASRASVRPQSPTIQPTHGSIPKDAGGDR